MGGVLHNTGSFTGASYKENVKDGLKRGTYDLCSCVHCPLEGLAVCCTTVPVPDSDAVGQHSQWPPCRRWWGWVEGDLLYSASGESVGAVVPSWRLTWSRWVRSSVMYTPRNLVLLTLSTVKRSMVSGGWSTEFLLKSITTSFVLLTLRDRLRDTIQPAVPLPLCSVFHRCCWWDLLMCHRQTWWCSWSWTWQCSRGSAVWRTAGWAQCGSARGVVADMDRQVFRLESPVSNYRGRDNYIIVWWKNCFIY